MPLPIEPPVPPATAPAATADSTGPAGPTTTAETAATLGGAKAQGWSVSLGFHGHTLVQRSVRGSAEVRIGEDPACTLVVPGLGDATMLTRGPCLRPLAGLAGQVHRQDAPDVPEALERELTLAPGDRATLHLVDHPEITLELRRQTFRCLPLSTLINLRELGLQLTLGAGLIAALALLVRHEAAVNTLAVKGDPDAPDDSPLVRAMFAVETPPSELRYYEPRVAPAVVPAMAAVPVVAVLEPAPLPLALGGEVFAVGADVIDPAAKQPRKRKRRGPEMIEMALLGALTDDGVVGDLLAGGVEGGTLGHSLLAEATDDRSNLAMLGLQGQHVADLDRVLADDTDGIVPEPTEQVEQLEQLEQLEQVEQLEQIMGPGADHDQPVLKAIPAAPATSASPRTVERGVADGLVAVAATTVCDDPTLVAARQLDLVFVLDVSTTMTFMLDRIDKQIAQVDREARAQGLDTRYGLVVFVDDIQLGNAGQPYAELAALQADLARWRSFTASNRQINSAAKNLDWPENSLDAIHAAATDFAWRPADTTLRVIVHATDDDFGEAPAIQSGQQVQHTYAQTLAALHHAQVRMLSFAAKLGGECECLDVRPGLYTRFHGKPSLPQATGGATFDIDALAAGKLPFASAVSGAIRSATCTRYPLSQDAGPQ